MSTFTDDYKERVKTMGWVYLPQLPANTPLGPEVAGAPGARSPWAVNGSSYELAPLPVRIEQGFNSVVSAVAAADATSDLMMVQWVEKIPQSLENLLTPTIQKLGLDSGVFGAAAKLAGIPVWVLVVVAIIVGYAVLMQYGFVPSLKTLVT